MKVPTDYKKKADILKKIIHGMELIFDPISQKLVEETNKEKRLSPSVIHEDQSHEEIFLIRQIKQIERLAERILYIKCEAPYIVLRFINNPEQRPVLLRLSMKDITNHFQEKTFLRIHKSYFINPQRVLCIRKKRHPDYEMFLQAEPSNKIEIPIGRSYHKNLRTNYMRWFDSLQPIEK